MAMRSLKEKRENVIAFHWIVTFENHNVISKQIPKCGGFVYPSSFKKKKKKKFSAIVRDNPMQIVQKGEEPELR